MCVQRCVIRCLVQQRFLIAGGAAPEVEVATQLNRWAKTLVVRAPHARKRFPALPDALWPEGCWGTYM